MSIATAAPPEPKPTASSRFPLWLLGIGLLALLGSAALAARLIWEMTVWTWERGPQMVGYMLVHGSGGVLVLFPPLLVLWLAVAIAYTLRRLLKRRPLSRVSVITMVLSVGLLWLMSLPYGFWQRLFIDRLISGPKAAEFFVYAAALGDLATVKTFLAHGIPVDIRDGGKTALYGATVGGKTEVLKYLIAAGADANATDSWGESPLAVAIAEKHQEAAAVLSEHGAKIIHGTEEQRAKARQDFRAAIPYPPSTTAPAGRSGPDAK